MKTYFASAPPCSTSWTGMAHGIIMLQLALFFPVSLYSQELKLSHQVIPKEIATGAVHAILEDQFGFIWYGGDAGLYRYGGFSFKKYGAPTNEEGSNSTLGTVYALLADRKGKIWIGTIEGLFHYERETDKLTQVFKNDLLDKNGKASPVLSLLEDRKGGIWIGTRDRLLYAPGAQKEHVKRVEALDVVPSYQLRSGVRGIVEDGKGQIFAATTNGLWAIKNDLSATQFVPEIIKKTKDLYRIFDVEVGNGDSLWLATYRGLWLFESGTGRFTQISLPGGNDKLVRELLIDEAGHLFIAYIDEIWRRSPSGKLEQLTSKSFPISADINAMAKDRFGNLWIGGNRGFARLDLWLDESIPLYRVIGKASSQDNYFFHLMLDKSGRLWTRMIKTGLGYCPQVGGEFELLLQPPKKGVEEIKNFCSDIDSNIWVCTLTNGIYRFSKNSKKGIAIDLSDSMNVARTLDILSDRLNTQLIWFSSMFGLCSFDRFTFERHWYHPTKDLPWLDWDAIGEIEQDAEGNIWCSMMAGGKSLVGYFDMKIGRFIAEPNPEKRPDCSKVLQFFFNLNDTIYGATSTGLLVIDVKRKTQSLITKKVGLPTNGVSSIIADRNGNIWYSSGLKICRFKGKSFETFNANNAIGGFAYNSSALTEDGRIIFGGENGLHVFDPNKIKKDTIRPKVYLTNFLVQNNSYNFDEAYELVKEITMPYDKNSLSFEYAVNHFILPERIKCQYKLEGFDKDWISTNNDNQRLSYSNLQPGKYTLKVKAINADGFESNVEESINIKLSILPPWYRTWWAYLIYFLILIWILYTIRNYELRRHLAIAETRRLHELDQFKTRLYTNITHEFRTPLTIILGEASQLQQQVSEPLKTNLAAIRRNGQQLLNLVNQMLDLAKLEGGSIKLNLVQGDVILFLKYLLESFQSFAASKTISMSFSSTMDRFSMDYDAERLRQIVVNLLSNALKFTPAGGEVRLGVALQNEQQSEKITIAVSDTGEGIPTEKLPRIFDRFYQADDSATRQSEGTGIGLALTSELVKLLDGKITVESDSGKGSTFIVSLPVTRNAALATAEIAALDFSEFQNPPSSETTPVSPSAKKGKTPAAQQLPNLLIIEDNPDVLNYVAGILKNDYQISIAQNGKLGLEQAIETTPDLILSDVMMPEMDGYEVCRALKADLRTSHIPIVLLTAKADFDSRMEGMEGGAEAYLAKPFDERELLLVLRKLLENRELLRRHFTSSQFIESSSKQEAGLTTNKPDAPLTNPRDEQFLKEVLQMVEVHLSDSELNAERLAELLFISYNSLFKKIKALTGMGVTEYIRHIRLHHAAELLIKKEDWTISRISLEVGFNNLNFFSREFKKSFRHSPSEYRHRGKT